MGAADNALPRFFLDVRHRQRKTQFLKAFKHLPIALVPVVLDLLERRAELLVLRVEIIAQDMHGLGVFRGDLHA